MKKILNNIFYILKFILLFISFGLTFYIILGMYTRLQKNMVDSFDIFIPFLIVLVVFCINFIKNHELIKTNLFYNLTCCLVFSTIIFIGCRAILDKNMVLNTIMGYNINFSYFSDFIVFLKIMLYGLVASNIFLVLSSIKNKSKKSNDDIEVL